MPGNPIQRIHLGGYLLCYLKCIRVLAWQTIYLFHGLVLSPDAMAVILDRQISRAFGFVELSGAVVMRTTWKSYSRCSLNLLYHHHKATKIGLMTTVFVNPPGG